MLTFDLNVTMEILVLNSAVQGFAVGCVWVPMTIVAFDTLDAKDRAEASSVFHLLRNIGSSFFISLSIAEIVRTTGANYSRMTEMITPYNHALTMPSVTGAWNFDTVPGLAKVAERDRPPVGDDRLSQRLHDVHGDLRARGRVRPDGAAARSQPDARLTANRLARARHEPIAASKAPTTSSISLGRHQERCAELDGFGERLRAAPPSESTGGKVCGLRRLCRSARPSAWSRRAPRPSPWCRTRARASRPARRARSRAGRSRRCANVDLQRDDVARVGRRLALEQSRVDLARSDRRG